MIPPSRKGSKMPKSFIEKQRIRMRGNKNTLGKKLTDEHREKIRVSLLGNKNRLGDKLSEVTKLKMSEAKRGDKAYQWLGGKSFEPYSLDWTKTLKKSIRERDHYICQICLGEGIAVHHIDYNKNNCNPINLITLCRNCHAKTNHNRDYWQELLTKKDD